METSTHATLYNFTRIDVLKEMENRSQNKISKSIAHDRVSATVILLGLIAGNFIIGLIIYLFLLWL